MRASRRRELCRGGYLEDVRDRGAEIALVTATRGDAGRAGEPPIILSVETFRQAFGPPLSKRLATDIFESIVD